MKWIHLASAVLTSLGLAASAQAGGGCLSGGNGKCCGCASDCQPVCCKPTIQIPCEPTVHTYQRQCAPARPACCKPTCCNTCPAPKCCAPKTCCTTSCGSSGNTCQSGSCGGKGCGNMFSFFKKKNNTCCNTCGSSSCGGNCNGGCQQTCQSVEVKCCDPADACEIAQLIYESQTACYAKQRAHALCKLGKYDCVCNPEIIGAFIYGLNDADERVRRKAADKLGDQLEDNQCCCSPAVIAALTCALGDCDKCVVKQAKQGLENCGYEVVDGCCCPKQGCGKGGINLAGFFGGCKKNKCQSTTCCTTTCNSGCATGNCATGGCANGSCGVAAPAGAPVHGAPIQGAPAPQPGPIAPSAVPAAPAPPATPATAPAATPAPAPPAAPAAAPQTQYIPVRAKKSSLAGLLGLAN